MILRFGGAYLRITGAAGAAITGREKMHADADDKSLRLYRMADFGARGFYRRRRAAHASYDGDDAHDDLPSCDARR